MNGYLNFSADTMVQQHRREDKFRHLWNLIGNTPMLEISYRYRNMAGKIHVKCEHYNLTGSIKDRMALYILEQAYKNGSIKEGDTIVEATSGNTGIAFSAIGKALGHPVKIIMPDWLSRERMDIIRSLGAEIILISKQEGGFLGSIALSNKMAAENPDIFLPQQFENIYNAEAHEMTTGREIWAQLHSAGITPDAFVAGVGTGGTVMGVGKYLRDLQHNIKIHPLEPLESPTLSTGRKNGSHRIQGISDEFIPAIVRLHELDDVVQVSDGDSILLAQKLASGLGLAVGISSGANLLGAIQLQNRYGFGKTVVTVFSDSNKKYLSTDLMNQEPTQKHFLSPQIDLIGYKSFSRI